MLEKLLTATDDEVVAASATTDVDFGVHTQNPIVLANTEEAS